MRWSKAGGREPGTLLSICITAERDVVIRSGVDGRELGTLSICIIAAEREVVFIIGRNTPLYLRGVRLA
jgi:hypothetical protein